MSLDSDLAQYSYQLQELEKIPLFQRGSEDNATISKLRAEIAAIIREMTKNA